MDQKIIAQIEKFILTFIHFRAPLKLNARETTGEELDVELCEEIVDIRRRVDNFPEENKNFTNSNSDFYFHVLTILDRRDSVCSLSRL